MRIRDIAIGALLSGMLAGAVLLTLPAPEPVRPVLPAPKGVPAPAAWTAPPAAVSAAAPPVPSWRAMHAQFVHAPNLRVFFYKAMRDPGNGAFYYAMNVLHTCRLALEAAADLSAARRDAAAQLRQRCDFTQQGLDDAQRELHAARGLDVSRDKQLGSMFDYLAADGAEGRAAMLHAAFEQGNPEVIAALLAHTVEGGTPAPDDADSTARGVPHGAMLAACRLGADCGPEALRTLELCVRQGWCAGSVPAALEQGLGKHFAALDRMAARAVLRR